MKLKQAFFLIFSVVIRSGASAENPMFGSDDKAVGIYAGQGTGNNHPSLLHLAYPAAWRFEPMTAAMIQYSEPATIFGIPARQNAHLVFNGGYGSDHDLSFVAIGISWDIAFFDWRGFYAGIGIGPYYKSSMDRYVSSRLTAGPKFFIGATLAGHWRAELFTLHFSNGDLTPVNKGFNFAGFALTHSF
jgi:hypothetical protein